MSTFASAARMGRPDGVRPRHLSPPKARIREVRTRPSAQGPCPVPETGETRYSVLDPKIWPAWTSEVRIALGPKGGAR